VKANNKAAGEVSGILLSAGERELGGDAFKVEDARRWRPDCGWEPVMQFGKEANWVPSTKPNRNRNQGWKS